MSQSLVRRITDHLKSGGWYFLAGLVAALLNYGFQVIASRELSRADFASLNGWFANFAVFLFLSGVLQYGSVFFPCSGRSLKLSIAVINFLTLVCAFLWFSSDETLSTFRAVLILLTSTAYGWVMGQVQFRLAFTLLAIVGLLQGVAKFAFVALPFFSEQRLEAYALSFFAAILPSLLVASIWLYRSKAPELVDTVHGWRSWVAPVILSSAVALMPQFDLVVMSHTQAQTTFEEFARASLFYKGVYFAVFIVAQWLLPQQIQRKAEFRGRGLVLAMGFAVIASLALTLMAPFVGTWLLKWESSPAAWLILGSCIHMSLLTLTYLGIQQACADGRVWGAAIAIVLIVTKGFIQLGLGLEASTYLVYAIALQLPIMFLLWRRTTNA